MDREAADSNRTPRGSRAPGLDCGVGHGGTPSGGKALSRQFRNVRSSPVTGRVCRNRRTAPVVAAAPRRPRNNGSFACGGPGGRAGGGDSYQASISRCSRASSFGGESPRSGLDPCAARPLAARPARHGTRRSTRPHSTTRCVRRPPSRLPPPRHPRQRTHRLATATDRPGRGQRRRDSQPSATSRAAACRRAASGLRSQRTVVPGRHRIHGLAKAIQVIAAPDPNLDERATRREPTRWPPLLWPRHAVSPTSELKSQASPWTTQLHRVPSKVG